MRFDLGILVGLVASISAVAAAPTANAGIVAAPMAHAQRVVVASKSFTESNLLGEMIALTLAAHTELEVEHRAGLGGTLICWEALTAGQIDVYPEYTGTGWAVVLGETNPIADPLQAFLSVRARCLELHDVDWSSPFGFDNSYVLALDAQRATELGIRTISDLAARGTDLRAALSIEFVHRADGWAGLAPFYGLELDVRTLEHGLAYAAIESGEADLVDAYATDGKLLRLDLTLLEDDRGFFPPYHAAPVVRGELLRAHPEVGAALELLAFRLPAERMRALNHAVEIEGRPIAEVAHAFLTAEGVLKARTDGREPSSRSTGARGYRDDPVLARQATRGATVRLRLGARLTLLWRRACAFGTFMFERRGETLALTVQHLQLTLAAVLLAAAAAIPLGIAITRSRSAARVVLSLSGIVQTIPSLALLAFMIAIPGLGLSMQSAICALFLYALLPIVRNTFAGIRGVDPELVDAARGLGLTERQLLVRIQLPLALCTILAGVRTATVISIGVATLAAFIGAGGLGEPIVTGLYLNDHWLILAGALPAAILALVADGLLGWLERHLLPRGLTVGPGSA